jgi:hypothetical protein
MQVNFSSVLTSSVEVYFSETKTLRMFMEICSRLEQVTKDFLPCMSDRIAYKLILHHHRRFYSRC